MTTTAYTESAFESSIVAHLVDHGGWRPGDPADYDRDRALLTADLLAFVAETQPKPFAKVRVIHVAQLEARFVDALCEELAQRGSLAVLRHDFSFYGRAFQLAVFKPAHGLNPAVEALYGANRPTVLRQVHGDPKQPGRTPSTSCCS